MKNLKKNSIILLAITIVVLICVLKDDFSNIINTLSGANYGWIIIALLCFFVGIGFEAKAYQEIIQGYEYDYTFKKSYRMLLITKFFNGITPFSSGGQPMQIYMLQNHGFRYTKATNVIMQNFIVYQLALVIFGLFAVIYNFITGVLVYKSVLTTLIILGFLINTIVAVVMLFVATSKKFTKSLLNIITIFGNNLHFIKNKEKFLAKWEERLEDFHDCTR